MGHLFGCTYPYSFVIIIIWCAARVYKISEIFCRDLISTVVYLMPFLISFSLEVEYWMCIIKLALFTLAFFQEHLLEYFFIIGLLFQNKTKQPYLAQHLISGKANTLKQRGVNTFATF